MSLSVAEPGGAVIFGPGSISLRFVFEIATTASRQPKFTLQKPRPPEESGGHIFFVAEMADRQKFPPFGSRRLRHAFA